MNFNFPIPTELGALLERLKLEERELVRLLALVEERIRLFEDRERPDYEHWIRLEIGPRLALLEEIYARVHERRLFALRINELIEKHGYPPREALYIATTRIDSARDAEEMGAASQGDLNANPGDASGRNWDPDEIAARKQAKRESKRAERRANAKAKRAPPVETASPQHSLKRRVVALYRALARRLHPDSPHALTDSRAPALWLEAQAAYEASDLDRLLALSVWLGGGEGNEVSNRAQPTLTERYERLRALGRSLAKMKRRLSESNAHPAWGFGSPEGVSRKKLRKQAAREIEQEMADAQETLEALEDFIASIGPARPPREKKGRGR